MDVHKQGGASVFYKGVASLIHLQGHTLHCTLTTRLDFHKRRGAHVEQVSQTIIHVFLSQPSTCLHCTKCTDRDVQSDMNDEAADLLLTCHQLPANICVLSQPRLLQSTTQTSNWALPKALETESDDGSFHRYPCLDEIHCQKE